ncbi:hypothetical protein HO173_013102 [Letharia columbiana]|uniref:AA9 family lytic polysaccharide monooxygenase n=1 Tax=Letharia columbiana TaxID=112416 RepID=A0A8H6CI28_9LECA|nr:uncharacterized protein HO173_013102 [Letharia columbiana]KAF6223857.1 hypothetical protein HO173_013102 [Letharia columbiana]
MREPSYTFHGKIQGSLVYCPECKVHRDHGGAIPKDLWQLEEPPLRLLAKVMGRYFIVLREFQLFLTALVAFKYSFTSLLPLFHYFTSTATALPPSKPTTLKTPASKVILLRRERSTKAGFNNNMSSIMSILSFSAALFAATTSAHMILGSPPPYGSPDNSPLVADGSNFPCKATSNAGAIVTEMAIGAAQPLWFIGSAVHGGGSCQISLTTDMPATKSSSWMVIHSIEGGCPAKGVSGNDAAGQSGGSNYTYTIPQGITPGSYTLAWTWFNKIGNREMYMNCASIKVSGGSKKRAATLNETLGIPELYERTTPSFPGMFKANIPTTDCETVDSADVLFPDPGASVEKDGTSALTAPTGAKCNVVAGGGSSASNSSTAAAGSSSSGSSSGSSGSGSSGSGSSGSGSSAPASPGSSSAASAAPSMATSDAPASAATSMAAAPSVSASPVVAAAPSVAAAAPSSAPSAITNSSSSSTTPSTSSTGTCSTAGQSVCSPDGKQIGECTPQLTVTWIPVADGTKCVGGYQVFAKRSNPKFQKGYVRRGEGLGIW